MQSMEPREIVDPMGNRLRFWIEDVQVGKPMLPDKEQRSLNRFVLPAECRERGVTYKGRMTCKFVWSVNGGQPRTETRQLGGLPIMVKSEKCHLNGLSPKRLTLKKEDPDELGGYFIINGIERIIRLLIVARRNHPMALIRPSFAKRGPLYTPYGCQMRCVRPDQSSQTLYLHYLSDGNVMVRFSFRKNEYLIPLVLILKALIDTDDKEIMESIVQGDFEDTFMTGRLEMMLRDFKRFNLFTRDQCREYLGSRFAVVMNSLPKDTPSHQVGTEFLSRLIMVHLSNDRDKFNALVFMTRKLYGLVSEKACADNPDSPMLQELLLSGHLFMVYLKEKIDDWLSSLQISISADIRKTPNLVNFGGDCAYLRKVMAKVPSDVGKKMEYFLATGNLLSNTGLDLQQVTGFTVVAEKLNFLRYVSHFRSVHRGAFFAELKTTTVRKLLPEAWGFLCPVHTPDGAPCGLLNHLAHQCKVQTHSVELPELFLSKLYSMGVEPMEKAAKWQPEMLSVILDGKLVGMVKPGQADLVAQNLRYCKSARDATIPELLEVAFVPPSQGGLFPGLYLFSGPARMMRPVSFIDGPTDRRTVFIGSLEQVYLDIAVTEEEVALVPSAYQFVELAPTNMLSVIANTTPFCDFNQSPRNMYQCQMGKQSMGTPCHGYPHRSDNKLYRLYFPQTPLVKTQLHSTYSFDHFPNGTNAVVAVIAYTGYDMEDAMILNKSSFERGFAHACVYKSEFVEIEGGKRSTDAPKHFGVVADQKSMGAMRTIDMDGLPAVGQKIVPDDPLYGVVDEVSASHKLERYKSFEEAYVDEVRLLGDDCGEEELKRVHIKFRIPRNPVIGDKFSSRHGQKGVCSQKYPLVDMPFTESGMTPDLIINPHAFPSRMTIGMFVESMAGKAGAVHGLAQDATPFRFGEDCTASSYFGEQLLAAGYNYYGNEPMYSGISGTEMRVDIYIGCVYYQRLRHMVSDKYQVRTTGPVHNLTQQPVKGRKRAGGIRLGEMERDSLLAHGTSFILQDRLFNCSDYSQSYVCGGCGSLLSCVNNKCRQCDSVKGVKVVAVPFVLRYLCAELMAMNINMRFTL